MTVASASTAGCESWAYVEEFSQGHTFRRCGRRICDDCYKAYGDLCDDYEHLPPDPDEAFYEAADVLRDWAMDRSESPRGETREDR